MSQTDPGQTDPVQRNWAGNVDLGADTVHEPRSLDELAELVSGPRRVRVVGSRHSFNELTRTEDLLVGLGRLPGDVEQTADGLRVPAWWTFGRLTAELAARGVALRALASLPHISLAGACATGTHGSGDSNRGLAGAVSAVDLVQADGSTLTLRRGDADFPAAVVSLGALGVATSMTLDVEPAFDVRQDVYDDVSVGPYGDELLDALGDAYSVSLFTVLDSDRFTMAWLKQRVPDGGTLPDVQPDWRGGRLAASARHPVPGQPTEGTTEQGLVGPWHERLPHFRLDVPPSSRGAELQSELLLPRAAAPDAWRELLRVREHVAPHVQTVEVRSIAADAEWLSPAAGRDTVAFHFTWVPDAERVRGALTVLEPLLEPFDPRPHWGKVFVTPVEQVAARYPERARFAEVVRRRDPEGRFRNAFVEAVLG